MNFPLFVDLEGKKAVVVGGGTIACRRIAILLQFGATVTVIAPTFAGDATAVTWLPRPYASEDLAGAFLVVAATDVRDVNHRVGVDAKRLRLPVSVADRREECSFFFPAICFGEGLVAGITSDGTRHDRTAWAARAVRKTLEALKWKESE